MNKVDIKIGQSIYNDVAIINVDKADGSTANFLYEGLPKTINISTNIVDTNITSTISKTRTIITSISLEG